MKVEKVRGHIELTTNQGVLLKIEECKDGIHIVCGTGNIETLNTSGKGIIVISDESNKF